MKRRQIKEVALREIRVRGRSRGYRFITGVMLLVAIAAPIVISILPSPSDDLRDVTIGLGANVIDGLGDQIESLATDSFDVTLVEFDGVAEDEMNEQLRTGRLDVAVRAPRLLIWDETEDTSLTNLLTAAFQQAEARQRALDLDVDLVDLAEVFTPVEVEQEFVAGSSNTESVRSGVAFFGLMLAFLLPQIFGQFTMMSVVEEKSTRVVEVLLSQIRPGTLLAGKILGICALAVLQLFVIVIGLVAALLVTNAADVPASVWAFVPTMTISILAGLAIYTTLFALLGSLISRQEDQAQVMMPVFAPLMIGYFVGQTAVFGNAEAFIVKLLTWIPLTAPLILPVRVARDAIGPIEMTAAIGLMILTAYLLFKLAARVYEFTLLRTGSRVGWGELIRLSRGSVLE